MKWVKKGLIYAPAGENGWKNQFAMCPVPFLIDKDRLRVLVNMCDENMIGRVGYVDVNPENPSEVYAVSETPVLDIGKAGAFDDHGAVILDLLNLGDKLYMYYVGFQLGVNVPYYMFGGLAVSKDGGRTFKRYSQSPVLDRRGDEIYARCGIQVLKDNGKIKMWYIGSCKDGWTTAQGKLKPLYTMMYTESDDGIHWNKEPVQCMEYASADEHGFGRPHVWKDGGKYKMIYSIRTYSRGYYLGYAESDDGIHWIRKDDEVGIGLSETGWDSENVSYGYRFVYGDKTYLFYNGNGCGKTGFGYAELVRE
ncbi:MAG: hypothetical protein J5716_08630 [Alphaproteobacteria bacterium]|nr:hypothetical protein [Alphaproteobacteria bacterium]